MKDKIKIVVIGMLLIFGAAAQTSAQNLIQPFNVSLVAYDQVTGTSVRGVRLTTRDLIRLFVGTNVPAGRLWLVTPPGALGPNGNLNAFLRITSGITTVLEVPSPESFNVFQDSASVSMSGSRVTMLALNRFSFDFGGFHAELQGFSTWVGTTGGRGSFVSTVTGQGAADGTTVTGGPMRGSVSGGAQHTEN